MQAGAQEKIAAVGVHGNPAKGPNTNSSNSTRGQGVVVALCS
uniref:Uncharacterized protein n=1 Tax=Setaria italica TaxID=4555 RepID=K3YNI5_SETIT